MPAGKAERIGREFADNAERSGGRSMILMGAGTNHWFHSDTIYRTFLALTTMTGCQGVNGGGWAHYVGQEKVRPLTGYNQYAGGADWVRPPRAMIGTAFWYLATDQWRYDGLPADGSASSLRGSSPTAPPPTASSSRQSAAGCQATPRSTATRSTSSTRPTRSARIPHRRGRPAEGGQPALRRGRPGCTAELPARGECLARQHPRVVGQGQRILPEAPARHGCRGAASEATTDQRAAISRGATPPRASSTFS